MGYKFIKTIDPNNNHDVTEIIHEIKCHDITADRLFEEFKEFVAGCGYYIPYTDELVLLSEDEIIVKKEEIKGDYSN